MKIYLGDMQLKQKTALPTIFLLSGVPADSAQLVGVMQRILEPDENTVFIISVELSSMKPPTPSIFVVVVAS